MSVQLRAGAAAAVGDVQAYLAACTARIDAEIALVIEAEVEDPWLRGAIDYHFGWAGIDFALLPCAERVPSGKRFRPALALLCYQGALAAQGRDSDEAEAAVPFATALELVHNYSLIHDDIQDRDVLRRGRPTVWSICGEAQAINVGNCLHAAAFAACLGRWQAPGTPPPVATELVTALATASLRMTGGQRRDLTFETESDVSVDRYLHMVAGKTAALITCATYGGALLASAGCRGAPARRDEEPLLAFAQFGHHLGLGFQIRDDILGIWGTESRTGKASGNDIRRRKRTLPMLLALRDAPPAARQRLRALFSSTGDVTGRQERDVRSILDDCGAQASAQAQADLNGRRALAALSEAAGCPGGLRDNPYFAALEHLSTFAITRSG